MEYIKFKKVNLTNNGSQCENCCGWFRYKLEVVNNTYCCDNCMRQMGLDKYIPIINFNNVFSRTLG